ncbi:MAG TPA: DeoR/GlpR transcriptional regulator [Flammeovirgaceae bacterium]|nr:DeoR/GlpR transcriptional regulator [Flammeovirgaceae bacterium]
MKIAKRQARILREVQLHNRVLVNDLAAMLAVSPDTIRRDIIALDKAGKLKRVHGGARALGYQPYDYRGADIYLREQKDIIAGKALQYIESDQVILISGGTTNLELVRMLPGDLEATFFTPSLPVAMQLLEHPGLKVIMLGGELSAEAQVAVGVSTLNMLSEVRFDLCLLGTGYLHPGAGLTEVDWQVAQLKKAMIRASRKVISLAVAEKLNSVQRYKICQVNEIDLLITDLEPDKDVLQPYRQAGLNVI